MRGLALPALLLGVSASLIVSGPPVASPMAPVVILLDRASFPADSVAGVTLISHALTPLVVPDCGAVIGGSTAGGRTAPDFVICATASGTVMPGDTISFVLPELPRGRYDLALSMTMNRSDLPPLQLTTPQLAFTVR